MTKDEAKAAVERMRPLFENWQKKEARCDCETCTPQGDGFKKPMRMICCTTCGNKRCPHATDHRNACTGSSEPGQKGSSWEDPKSDAMMEKLNTSPRFSAEAVNELLAQARSVRAAETAHDWRGMDGAIAWHLIERHADGWGDVGAMMEAWRVANLPAPKELK